MLTSIELIFGAILLLLGGETLVRGAAQIAVRFGLSRLMVGMVIAGFGTSMPEMVVSVRAVLGGTPGLAAGNVVGSNISNILLILAIAALIRPIDMPSRRLDPEGVILLAVCAVVMALGLQETIPRWQGAAMVLLMIGIIVMKFREDRTAEGRQEATEEIVETVAPFSLDSLKPFVYILIGIVALPLGGDMFVRGAVDIAQALGVSDALIGLTIVAIGTSLPELATTAIAALRGETTIGYGNIIGSNLFNTLGIFGVATMVGPMHVPETVVYADGGFMVAATAVMLVFMSTGARLNRIEAGIMLSAYIIYITARYAFAMSG